MPITSRATTIKRKNACLYQNAVVATANDTTATAYSQPINNLDGSIESITVHSVVSANSSGGNFVLTLQGSNDGTNFADIKKEGGASTLTTGNVAISTASAGAPISAFLDTVERLRRTFPAYIRVKETLSSGGRTSITNVHVTYKATPYNA